MEAKVAAAFTKEVLAECAARYGMDVSSLELLGDMENFVYCGVSGDIPLVLRVTHESHRTSNEIRAEIEYISFLRTCGVRVVKVVQSKSGNSIEQVVTGETCFWVVAFEKIQGAPILDAEACNPGVYKKWGALVGQMHAASKKFHPRSEQNNRKSWFEDDLIINIEQYIHGQSGVLKKAHQLFRYLESLPVSLESFGLIHADLNDVNFFIYNGELTAFDFDDSVHHFFVYDFAVVLYDSIPWMPHDKLARKDFINYFWRFFSEGYLEQNWLDPFWIQQLPNFTKLREIILYTVYHKKWDVNQVGLNALKESHRNYLIKLRKRIESDHSILEHKLPWS